MRIITSDIFFAFLAFLTVNSVVSLLRTLLSVILPGISIWMNGKRSDYEPMIVAAERFNTGVLDRFKRKRRLGRLAKQGVIARGASQTLFTRYTLLISAIICLIIGAEVMALLILRPRRFELKSSEVNLKMHGVVKSIDRTRASPTDFTGCSILKNRKTSDSGTLIWESHACTKVIIGSTEAVSREEKRASSSGDKFRLDVYFSRAKGDSYSSMIWTPANSTEHLYITVHDVEVLSFGSARTTTYKNVPSQLIEDMLEFALQRRYGDLCRVSEKKKTKEFQRVLQVVCDRKIGRLDDLRATYMTAGSELFTAVDSHPLFSLGVRNGVIVKGKPFDPVVQVVYGIKLASWRLLLPGFLIGLAIISSAAKSWIVKDASLEAHSDLLKRASVDASDLLPFSGPCPKVHQVLVNAGESYHLELKETAHSDSLLAGKSKELR